MALSIPPKPFDFRHDLAPPGYRKLYVSFAATRKRITPRLQLIHTNGGSVSSTIENCKAWSERRTYNGTVTTLPTFQVDLDGDAAQFIDSNQAQNACYKANPFAISYETADRGYKTDPYPTGSYFTEPQLQAICNGVAYCSILYKIPLAYPATWDGTGTACHTEPFAYPYWTMYKGKACPGNRKMAQVKEIILPHASAIVAAWTGTTTVPQPTPPPGGEVNWNPTAATVSTVKDAPPVAETVAGKWNDWAVIAMLKTIQEQNKLPITGKYDQATATVIDATVAA